jgi:hypothetical protein
MLPEQGYPDDEKRRAFQARLLDRIAELPGIEAAALASSVRIWPFGSSTNLVAEGQAPPAPAQEPLFYVTPVSADYFETLGIPLVMGTTLSSDTRAGGPKVAVINEAAARRFWPGESPIGKRLGYGGDEPEWREVVGVVGDVRFPADLASPDTTYQIYVPLEQAPSRWLVVAARTPKSQGSWRRPSARPSSPWTPTFPRFDLATLAEHVRRTLTSFGLAGHVLSAFGLLGLPLAALGIYGVIANVVVRRTSEFGIRMAIGAQVGEVVWLVLGGASGSCSGGR